MTFAGWDSGYGNLVQIRHSGGLTTGYAHLSKIAVRSGSTVAQGDFIGNVGQTGLATGPHLHYMMTKNGKPIAELRPHAGKRPRLPFGVHKGLVEIKGDIVSPIDVKWEALK